jgi:REP element-mobilizing transposase RayT
MPNHIHLVFDLLSKERIVGDIMKSIKQFSARRINKIRKQDGAFWQAESYDRLIRDEVELYFIIKYVLMNPVNAGLTDNWRKWKGTYCNPEFEVIE